MTDSTPTPVYDLSALEIQRRCRDLIQRLREARARYMTPVSADDGHRRRMAPAQPIRARKCRELMRTLQWLEDRIAAWPTLDDATLSEERAAVSGFFATLKEECDRLTL